MDAEQRELEARVFALEYAVQIVVLSLADWDGFDRADLLRRLEETANSPEAATAHPDLPNALRKLAMRF